MMSFDPNYDRNAAENSGADFKYKDHFKPFAVEHELSGDVYDVEVLNVHSKAWTKTYKEKTVTKDMITVALKIKDEYWIDLTLWGGAYKDGKTGRNPVQTHDFLCLAMRQRKDALAGATNYTFEQSGDTITRYPNLTGLKFKLAIAKTGETPKGYEKYDFAFFDKNGFSAPELETNADKPISLGLVLEDLKAKYSAWKTGQESSNPYSQIPLPTEEEAEPSVYDDNVPF